MDYQFEPDAQTDFSESPGGTKVLEFVLGYDLDLGTVVYMQVILVKADSYAQGEYENIYDLQFGIREKLVAMPSMLSCLDYSIISSRRFIPVSERPWVAATVIACIEWLITNFRPEYLTMETYHPDLPDKAMEKYHRITTVLTGLGYRTKESFQGTGGIHYWLYGVT